jgi:predicted AAA+ superfamily ATPase
MNDSNNSFSQVHLELRRRLSEPAPSRVQVLSGPRQVGKTTLLLELKTEFPDHAIYAAADTTEAALSGWWEHLWREAERLASSVGGAVLLVDELPYLTDWARRLKTEADRIHRQRVPLHIVVSGSSAIGLGAGARETMAGRFERLRLLHWPASELVKQLRLSPTEAVDQMVRFGSYPGAQSLLSDPVRWKSYLRDSIVEPAIGRDVLTIEAIRKPALLRQVYAVSTGHPAEIVSLQKLCGQLSGKGAMETVAHYLHVLEEACLIAALPKYARTAVRQRAAPPKLITLNNALLAAGGSADPVTNPEKWGRWVENACAAFAWNAGQRVSYWRAEPLEVDMVLEGDWGHWAVEVKTGDYTTRDLRGLLEFCRINSDIRPLMLCDEGQEAIASQAGVSAQSWQSFLLEGPR